MPDIHDRFERFLERELGNDSEDRGWREELLEHLVEAYEKSLSTGRDPEAAWSEAVERFGNIRKIEGDLERIHNVNITEWLLRFVAASTFLIAASSLGVFNIAGFVFAPAFFLVVIYPVVLYGSYLLWKREFEWKLKKIPWKKLEIPVIVGAFFGIGLGILNLVINLNEPSRIGLPMATVLLCSLYAAILTRPHSILMGLMAAGCLFCYSALFLVFEVSPFDMAGLGFPNLGPLITGVSLTLIGGFLFYGKERFLERIPQLGLIGMIAVQVLSLQKLEEPSALLPTILMSLLPLSLWFAPFVTKSEDLP